MRKHHIQSATYSYLTNRPTTRSTVTSTITSVSYPSQYLPYILPTYLYSYPTPSRISSACSCLSVPEYTTTISTTSYVGLPSQPLQFATTKSSQVSVATTTTTTNILYTGACATETPVPGAYNISSTASDAFLYSLGIDGLNVPYPNSAVPNCCGVCSDFSPFRGTGSDVQGFFGNCIGYVTAADGNCTLLLQGQLAAGYLQSLCHAYGFQPGTLYVDPTRYPFAAGGKGQCASTFDVVTT